MKKAWATWAGWMVGGALWALFGCIWLSKGQPVQLAIGMFGVAAAFGLRGVIGYVQSSKKDA